MHISDFILIIKNKEIYQTMLNKKNKIYIDDIRVAYLR